MGRKDHRVCLPGILPFPIMLTLAIILSPPSSCLIYPNFPYLLTFIFPTSIPSFPLPPYFNFPSTFKDFSHLPSLPFLQAPDCLCDSLLGARGGFFLCGGNFANQPSHVFCKWLTGTSKECSECLQSWPREDSTEG